MILYLSTPMLQVLKLFREHYPATTPNVLLSFGSKNPDTFHFLNTDRNTVGSLGYDSGTWSLNNTKNKSGFILTCESYRIHLENFGNMYDFYFNFDESWDEQAGIEINRRNQIHLENSGLKPVYVLHNSSNEEIDYCLERGYTFVGIGSSVLRKRQDTADLVFRLYNAGIKSHLFGSTKYSHLDSVPVYSCDSSTWTKNATMNDAIMYWNPANMRVDNTDKIHIETRMNACGKGTFCYSNYPFRQQVDNYLQQRLGISYDDLLGYNGCVNRRLVNMLYFMEMEERINQRHKELGYPW